MLLYTVLDKRSNLSWADGDAGVGQLDVGVGFGLHQQHVGALDVAVAVPVLLQVGAGVGELPHHGEEPLLGELLVHVLLLADAQERGDAAHRHVLQHHHVSVAGIFFWNVCCRKRLWYQEENLKICLQLLRLVKS